MRVIQRAATPRGIRFTEGSPATKDNLTEIFSSILWFEFSANEAMTRVWRQRQMKTVASYFCSPFMTIAMCSSDVQDVQAFTSCHEH